MHLPCCGEKKCDVTKFFWESDVLYNQSTLSNVINLLVIKETKHALAFLCHRLYEVEYRFQGRRSLMEIVQARRKHCRKSDCWNFAASWN